MGVEGYNKEKLDRLKEHKVAFDQEAVWANLKNKKKKRRGAIFFFTMALVALAIVFFIPFLNRDNNDQKSLSDRKLEKIEIEKYTDNAKNIEVQEESLSDNELTEKEPNSNADMLSADDLLLSKNRSKNRIIDKKTVEKSREVHTPEQSSHQSSNDNFDSNQLDERSINNNIENQFEQVISTSKLNEKKTSNSDKKENQEQAIKTQDAIFYNLLDLPFLKSIIGSRIQIPNDAFSSPPKEITVEETKSRFTLGGYAGVGVAQRSIRDSINIEESLEDVLEELSIGIELKYQLTPKLYTRSGVEYWHNTERGTSVSSEVFNLDNEDNESLGFAEDQKGLVLRTITTKKHIVYQSLNVPLIVGVNTNNDRWNAFAEAGVFSTFYRNLRGFDSNFEEKTSGIGFIPTVGVGGTYSLSNNTELFARASWRANQTMTNNSEGFTHREFSGMRGQIGFRIGL